METRTEKCTFEGWKNIFIERFTGEIEQPWSEWETVYSDTLLLAWWGADECPVTLAESEGHAMAATMEIVR